MRGEYGVKNAVDRVKTELPPRARRIQQCDRPGGVRGGTTSACAENTASAAMMVQMSGNYLRVRGEYSVMELTHSWNTELPPRARRILRALGLGLGATGTTSACAENTTKTPHG